MLRLPSSTAFRFAALFSAAFTLVIIVLGTGIYWAMRSELRYELDQRVGIERAAVLREAADDGVGLARTIAARAAHGQNDMGYAVLDAAGKRVAGQAIVAPPYLGWAAMDFVKPGGEPDVTRVFASRTADGVTLIVGSDPEAIEELDARMIPLFVAAFGVVAAIGIAGAFLLSGVLQQRLDAMTSTTETIIAGDLSRRMTLTGADDEFDRLSITLNRMLDRIAGLLDNLRQVSGDIAHDLRTPLTRLRQKLELAEAGPDDPSLLKEAMQAAIDQTDDMLGLFAESWISRKSRRAWQGSA